MSNNDIDSSGVYSVVTQVLFSWQFKCLSHPSFILVFKEGLVSILNINWNTFHGIWQWATAKDFFQGEAEKQLLLMIETTQQNFSYSRYAMT